MQSNTYTITYDPQTMNGEHGYWYEIRSRGRVVAEGWCRGKKHHAEREAKSAIDARDTLRSIAGLEA